MSFENGENVGAYRILAKLGQGGVATVYKAYHPALDRLVAIKVLHPAFKADPNFLERFRREARVVAKLEHPNIVPIYDFSEHHDQPYLVMKYIEGETLKARLAQMPLSLDEGFGIIEAVGKGLSHAHRHGVLHRDVKPSNILMSGQGEIYLADFGLARIAAAGESTLSSDMLMGTPQYISPEQAQGERDLDGRTDVYSFGVVLYEIVVGRVPFQADTPFSIIHDHIYTPLPLPTLINPQVPDQIERVLLKALAKDRGDRYEDVDQMVQAFHTSCHSMESGDLAEHTSVSASGSASIRARDGDSAVRNPAEGPSQKKTPEKGKRLRLGWLWILLGLFVACVSGLLLLAILSPDDSQEESGLPDNSPALIVENSPEESRAKNLEAEGLAEEGMQLAENGLFILAAEMYLQALDSPDLPIDLQAVYRDQLFQMLFLSAGSGEDFSFLVDETKHRYGDTMDLVPILFRTKLHRDGPDFIRDDINRAVERNPGNLELRLVRAEVWLMLDAEERFRQDIDFIFSHELVPDWIWHHAERLDSEFYGYEL